MKPTQQPKVEIEYYTADGKPARADYVLTDLKGSVLLRGSLSGGRSGPISLPVASGLVRWRTTNDVMYQPKQPYASLPNGRLGAYGTTGCAREVQQNSSLLLGKMSDWVWGVIAGDFVSNPSESQLWARMIIDSVPFVEKAVDVRDFAGLLGYKMIWQEGYRDSENWSDLCIVMLGAVAGPLGGVVRRVCHYIDLSGFQTSVESLLRLLNKMGEGNGVQFLRELQLRISGWMAEAVKVFRRILDGVGQALKALLAIPLSQSVISKLKESVGAIEKVGSSAENMFGRIGQQLTARLHVALARFKPIESLVRSGATVVRTQQATSDSLWMKFNRVCESGIYQGNWCHDNIHHLTKQMSDEDLDGAVVSYIFREGGGTFSGFGTGGDVPNWGHHVVLIKDERVFDFDYAKKAGPRDQWISDMLGGHDRQSNLAGLRERQIPARQYRDEYEREFTDPALIERQLKQHEDVLAGMYGRDNYRFDREMDEATVNITTRGGTYIKDRVYYSGQDAISSSIAERDLPSRPLQ